jgi:hypothetical protein
VWVVACKSSFAIWCSSVMFPGLWMPCLLYT